ncbi:MAG: DinB family protein [Planctomycetes bacterium]|nr:DinB family protein [Planctomycetota bacterium]
MNEPSTRELAHKQILFARAYTESLIADIEDGDWFQMPAGIKSHVAWQVGHLAMAEYGLCLFRQRGRADVDSSMMTSAFRKQFSRGSIPEPDPQRNPPPGEIRDVLARVHEQAMREIETFSDSQLAESVDMPYAAVPTKLGALLFCAHHEMLHAGQIGMIRRTLNKPPIR